MDPTLSVAKQFAAALPLGLTLVDAQGIIVALNQAACRLLGLVKEEAEGRPHELVVPGSQMARLLAKAEPHRYYLPLPHGSLWASAVPLVGGDGRLCGVAECYEDWGKLEELSAEVARLAEQNRLLDSILDSSHEFVAAVDLQGFITYMSEHTALRMGVDRHAVLGQAMEKVRSDCLLQRVVRTGVGQMGELWRVNRTAVPVMVLPILEDGRIEGAVGMSVFRNMEEARGFLKRLDCETCRGGAPEGRSRWVFEDIVGQSPSLVRAKELAQRAAQGNSTVLLQGESGCGKELFAHAIHFASQRRQGPFVSINCACIPESLLESELFGYEDGAFTGARRGGRLGKFELAHGGTIFLDEIGDMSHFMEAKLLRVLQEGEIQKLGSKAAKQVDVRVIAATNANLRAKVARGQFRQDLYYRLEGISVLIPPLRERGGDVALLIEHLLPLLAAKAGKQITGVDARVASRLAHYAWPGNVRELVNVLDAAVCLATRPLITWEDIPPHFRERTEASPQAAASRPGPAAEGEAVASLFAVEALDDSPSKLEELERSAIEEALRRTSGNKRRAALWLGMARSTFYEKLKKYDIHFAKRSG
ncbi:MAG: sigma 54-interacting transcriptional regulator [Deltaproteobacteria bacterium]|nr:sigma 54-interacting transcriptional regulator [Deltaproteobacteria bacterium]